jgi:hypothetical protein
MPKDPVRWVIWGGTAALAIYVGIDTFLNTPAPRPDPVSGLIDLVVLGGQSNAQGVTGNATDYPRAPFTDRKIWFRWEFVWGSPLTRWSGTDEWVGMRSQGGFFPAGHFGPEVALARRFVNSGRHIAVFKFVQPSSSLAEDWRPGDDNGTFALLRRSLNRAITDLKRDGTVRPTCFVWIQGEGDAEERSRAERYEENLRRIIAGARTELGSDIRIVLGAEESYTTTHDARVIEAQAKITKEDSRVRRVSMVGLEKSDAVHLTAHGIMGHGERIYDSCTSP